MKPVSKLFPDFDQQHVVLLPQHKSLHDSKVQTRSPLLFAGGLISSNHPNHAMTKSKAISMKSKGYSSLPAYKDEGMLLERNKK